MTPHFFPRIALAALSGLLAVTACSTPPESAPPDPPADLTDANGNVFAYDAAGNLAPGSGSGQTDTTVYMPGMRFPIEASPAYANSQVYGAGGLYGGGGGQCDAANYSYPWKDNFCETRSWSVSFCPTAQGHQGQDIRPGTCTKAVHWAVAAEAGEIYSIGSYSVSLMGESGTIYRYLHLDMAHLQVGVNTVVARGQRIGRVSNDFGDTVTTIHLHFDTKQSLTIDGVTDYYYVPPYTSLVAAYEALLSGSP